MTNATTTTAQRRSPVFACNLSAISAAERPRYNQLVKRVREGIRERRELANGYAFKLDGEAITPIELAEWIAMERLCCPFLTLQISVTGNQPHSLLRLTGPKGAKPIINAEFPALR